MGPYDCTGWNKYTTCLPQLPKVSTVSQVGSGTHTPLHLPNHSDWYFTTSSSSFPHINAPELFSICETRGLYFLGDKGAQEWSCTGPLGPSLWGLGPLGPHFWSGSMGTWLICISWCANFLKLATDSFPFVLPTLPLFHPPLLGDRSKDKRRVSKAAQRQCK